MKIAEFKTYVVSHGEEKTGFMRMYNHLLGYKIWYGMGLNGWNIVHDDDLIEELEYAFQAELDKDSGVNIEVIKNAKGKQIPIEFIKSWEDND